MNITPQRICLLILITHISLFRTSDAPHGTETKDNDFPVHKTKFDQISLITYRSVKTALFNDWRIQFYNSSVNKSEYDQNQTFILANKRKKRSIDYRTAFQIIGVFLAMHKYFETDRRKQGKFRTFFRGFPSPPFMHPDLQKTCGRGFHVCVEELFKMSKMNRRLSKLIATRFTNLPDWQDYASEKETENYFYPLASWMEYFAYKTTASYFMCWYTMMKEHQLAHFMDGRNCLYFLNLAGLGEVVDFRSDKKPFQCAMILFCPDPCYGRNDNGNLYTPGHITTDKGNPCRRFRNKTCKVIPDDNNDFLGLLWNKFNVTCSCLGKGRGFKYDSRNQKCVDINECAEKRHPCSNGKVCINFIGGYACTCRKGYKFNMDAQMCETPEETKIREMNRLKRQKGINAANNVFVNDILFIAVLSHSFVDSLVWLLKQCH